MNVVTHDQTHVVGPGWTGRDFGTRPSDDWLRSPIPRMVFLCSATRQNPQINRPCQRWKTRNRVDGFKRGVAQSEARTK